MIRKIDKGVFACVILLMGSGLLALYVKSPPEVISVAALTKSIFLKQALFACMGCVLIAVLAVPHYLHARKVAWILYVICIVALVLLLWKGRVTRGARAWFPVGPFHVQPAEMMKIAFILTLARVLMYVKDLDRWRDLFIPGLITLIPMGLILLQPDLGTAILFVPTFLAMIHVAGARRRHLILIVLALCVSAPVAYFTVLKQYQRDRLMSFMYPEDVPARLSYQQMQSQKAVAAGHFAGRSIGQEEAPIPFYVPDRHTDFIYSIVAEELGFLGASVILLLFAGFYTRSLRIAYHSREPFGRLVITGLVALLATQTFINLGMTIGVAPITGVTLPFISYGGSSLLSCAIMAAIILNVSARWKPGFASRELAGGSVAIHEIQPTVGFTSFDC